MMPNICGMTVSDAKKILEEYNLNIREGDYKEDDVIKKQIPEYGVKIKKEEDIIIETK